MFDALTLCGATVASQSVGAGQGAKPTAVAAAALRTVFASLSQQAARGGAAALAGVPDHVRDTLWRDFSAAGAPPGSHRHRACWTAGALRPLWDAL